MHPETKNNENKQEKSSAKVIIKSIVCIIMVTAMYTAGLYSLFLVSTSASTSQNFTTDNLIRKAAPSENDKIETALGHFDDKEFIFVVMDTSILGINANLEFSVRSAAQELADSGLASSVRILYPQDPDFGLIIEQNSISYFPSVLAVKREGGIIQIIENYSEEYLLFAYNAIWGKTSDCSDDKSAVY